MSIMILKRKELFFTFLRSLLKWKKGVATKQEMRKTMVSIWTILSVIVLYLFLTIESIEAKIPQVVLNQKKAVVTIYVYDDNGKQIATGSGFIVDPIGIIATNYHVISSGSIAKIKTEAEIYLPVEELIVYDADNDIAMLKVPGKNLPVVKLANNYKPRQGESIVIIGSPFGLETTVSDGIVSNIRGKRGLIQITAPISPGSSGSPVFNMKGEVIGVASFLIEGGQQLNFAVSAKYVIKQLNDYSRTKAKSEPAIDSKTKLVPIIDPYLIEQLERQAQSKKRIDGLDSSEWFARGYNAHKSGNYGEAASAYTKAIELNHPYLALTYYDRGLSYLDMSLLDQAIKDFTRAIELESNVFNYYKSRAYAYLQLNRCGDAIIDCNTMLQMSANYKPAYTLCAFANQCLGNLGQAIRDFDRVIEIDPKDASLHLFRGQVYYTLTNYDRAIIDFNRAIELDGTLASAYYSRAVLLMNTDVLLKLYFEKDKIAVAYLQALNDMKIAARLGHKTAQDYLSSRKQAW